MMDFVPRRVLVTGGAGFIGSNLVRFLLSHLPEATIINYDLLTYAGNLQNLETCLGDKRHQFVRGDICDADCLFRAVKGCDCVIHLAAETHVDRSILDSNPFVRTNVHGTQTLLDVAKRLEIPRLLVISTDEVYGPLPLYPVESRFSESSPLNPSSPYAASKAAADLLTQAHHRTFGTPAIITRCSNNFGPWQFPEKIIPLFIAKLLRGEAVPLYGDGLHVRDWIHVEDHCAALLRILTKGCIGRLYNIGADNERSNVDLARTLAKLLGRDDSCIRFVADRPGHDRRYAIDATRLRTELGWQPTRSAWPDALIETVDWYARHGEWLAQVMSGAYREFYDRWYGKRMADTP